MKRLEEGNVIWLRLPFDKNLKNISEDRHPYIIIKRTNRQLHLLQGDSYTDKKVKNDTKDRLKDPYIDILPVQPGLLDKPGYVRMDNIITIDNFENIPELVNNKKILRTNMKLEKAKLDHLKHNYSIKIKVKIQTRKFDPDRKFHIPVSLIDKLEKIQKAKEEKREKEKEKQLDNYNSLSKNSRKRKTTRTRN